MGFLKNVTSAVTDAKDYIVVKNKKTNAINKLKATIRKEKAKADKAYNALGRYYFHNLRDEANPVTEINCKEIEEAEDIIEKSALLLEKIYKEDIIKKDIDSKDDKAEYAESEEVIELSGADTPIDDGIIDEAVQSQE
ncbi:MAG: hypothetical protein R3Y35_08620 [Clostridia bacterium]